MGVYDTLVLPGTKADGEQVKCWFNDLSSIRAGDAVPTITTMRLKADKELPLEDDKPGAGVAGFSPPEYGEDDYEETPHRDYVIVMRCGGCLVVRDCKLQGYYVVGAIVPGDPPVETLLRFDKWGEAWVDTWNNNGILGEPYFYRDAAIVRTINSVARAYRYRDFGDDHDERSG